MLLLEWRRTVYIPSLVLGLGVNAQSSDWGPRWGPTRGSEDH